MKKMHQKNKKSRRMYMSYRSRQVQQQRRGILLLVVLSLLVLFMIVGTAFILKASQYQSNTKVFTKASRVSLQADDLLQQAVMQLLRDTQNQNSAIRYHSLLRDMYGIDGFTGSVCLPASTDPLLQAKLPKFAGATPIPNNIYGPSRGQFIDFLVDNTFVSNLKNLSGSQSASPVSLSRIKDYYNGSLLTFTSGRLRGQTTRIIGFEYLGEDSNPSPAGGELWRIRIMRVDHRNGTALEPNPGHAGLRAFLNSPLQSNKTAGVRFVVNGRPFNGTGVGYNRFAGNNPKTPRLSALEVLENKKTSTALGPWLPLGQLALLPNAQYYLGQASVPNPGTSGAFVSLRPFGYNNFVGPGGADESYDATDFQNMFLGFMPTIPQATAKLRLDSNGNPMFVDVSSMPIPSFHRPSLVNYTYKRLAAWVSTQAGASSASTDEVWNAVLYPYGKKFDRATIASSDAVKLELRDYIVAVKRKVLMRPIPEDHPQFSGSNIATQIRQFGNSRHRFWEAYGPWDIDNDNDGINDSVWVDPGFPIQQAENGQLYKPMIAYHVVDLDGKLNLNAHGLVEHLNVINPNFPTGSEPVSPFNKPLAGFLDSTGMLPRGIGYGPAEISLRSILWRGTINPMLMNPRDSRGGITDDYATLLGGVLTPTGEMLAGRYYGLSESGGFTSATPGASNGFGAHARLDLSNLVGIKGNGDLFLTDLSQDFRARYPLGLDVSGNLIYSFDYDGTSYLQVTSGTLNLNSTSIPYALNLNDASRHDLMSEYVSQDDAPFSLADLERLLRANDPDAGILSDRLVNLVEAFDSKKLVRKIVARDTPSNPNSAPSRMQQSRANQAAAANRRLVTTDSFDLPVPGGNLAFRLESLRFGKDGVTGNPGADNNNDNAIDLYDDFEFITRSKISKGSLMTLLRYKIVRSLLDAKIQLNVNGTSVPIATLTHYAGGFNHDGSPAAPNDQVAARRAIDKVINRVIHGRDDLASSQTRLAPYSFGGLLAPEVIAGQRMDINRPFGDGKDASFSPALGNVTAFPTKNRIVDEISEAGEPFWDQNDNGVWDPGSGTTGGEFFVDLNGDGGYNAPTDRMWSNLAAGIQGVASDFVYGRDVNGSGRYFDKNNNGVRDNSTDEPIMYDDAHLARQLYARHLYVLMLLQLDEEYVAPVNPQDFQAKAWIKSVAAAQKTGSAERDMFLARRKWTCRQIAQWAINVVDFRDADSSMTPFEYDENPFDGWGVPIPASGNAGQKHIHLPLDGDIGTNENYGEDNKSGNTNKADNPTGVNSTRGVVWGAERPELLITESYSTHDRRTEDTKAGGGTVKGGNDKGEDLDQRLGPYGTLVLELTNPWSDDAPRAAEICRYQNGKRHIVPNGDYEGVLLHRLTPRAVNKDGDLVASPVWRIAVVNKKKEQDVSSETKIPFVAFDPDLPLPLGARAPQAQGSGDNRSNKTIERVIYFIPAPKDFATAKRIHFPGVKRSAGQAGGSLDRIHSVKTAQDYISFLALDELNGDGEVDTIAPILPGRMAVIGSAGFDYSEAQKSKTNSDDYKFVLPIGRLRDANVEIPGGGAGRDGDPTSPDAGAEGTKSQDDDFLKVLDQARRLVLLPDKDPNVLDAKYRRLVYNNHNNLKATEKPVDGARAPLPIVMIPIRGMNLTEPIGGYPRKHTQKDENGKDLTLYWNPEGANGEGVYTSISDPGNAGRPDEPTSGNSEDRLEAFNTPFHKDRKVYNSQEEYTRYTTAVAKTGTIPNFRTLHLQRLANPMMPWNPAPGVSEVDRTASPHNPKLPVNPYLTIDTSSTDLTVFNGVSKQHDKSDTAPFVWKTNRPGEPAGSPPNSLHFRTLERGYEATALAKNDPVASRPTRLFWAQQPAHKAKGNQGGQGQAPGAAPRITYESDFFETAKGTPNSEQIARVDKPRTPNVYYQVIPMQLGHSLGRMNEAYSARSTETGLLWNQRGGVSPAPPTLATWTGREVPLIGYGYLFKLDGDDSTRITELNNLPTRPAGVSEQAYQKMLRFKEAHRNTFPWFTWKNRPYVSQNEIMQVPAYSSSTLLRQFSVLQRDNNESPTLDPYQEQGRVAASPGINPRWEAYKGYFGHQLNFYLGSEKVSEVSGTGANPTFTGAPHYYRLLDFIHVPSRFVGTQERLNHQTAFNSGATPVNWSTTRITADPAYATSNDPRLGFLPPFNLVSKQREPGRININTVNDPRVWDGGVNHRTLDSDTLRVMSPPRNAAPHAGPAFREFTPAPDATITGKDAIPSLVRIRRGYNSNDLTDPNLFLDSDYPTIVRRPYRSPSEANLVPIGELADLGGVASTLLQNTYKSGARDVRSPGFAMTNLTNPYAALGNRKKPYNNGDRNSYFHHMPQTRLGNLVTNRSNVYAVYITIGFFEVTPAPDWNDPNLTVRTSVRDRFFNNEALYNRVYPQGYQLGAELGSETGETKRYRSFYILDRSIPVGFKPGEDYNVEKAIRLRRRIE